MKKNQVSHGFTLLETLVTISIIASVGVLITQVFFSTARTNTKTELIKDVKQNGDFAIEIMSRMIHNALRIESVCGTTPTTLSSIDIRNPDNNVTTFGCLYNGGVARIASISAGGAQFQYLTSSNVTTGGTSCADVNNTLTFSCTSYIDQPSTVNIKFNLDQKGTPVDQFEKASVSFQTTVEPRN